MTMIIVGAGETSAIAENLFISKRVADITQADGFFTTYHVGRHYETAAETN